MAQVVAQIVLLVWMVGQASHAPSINEQRQATGGTIDILQQIVEALQKATQPAQVVPQRTTIERMAKYLPIDFLRKKDDEPYMVENWLETTEIMLREMHCTPKENLECVISLLQYDAYQWWVFMIRTTPPENITWEFFIAEFKKQYVGRLYLSNMRREFNNLKQRQMSVTKYQREFTMLSKYASEMLVTEEEKFCKFEDGLNDYIRAYVTRFGHDDYSKIATCALNIERVKKEEYDRKERRQSKKNPGQSSSYQHRNKKFRGP